MLLADQMSLDISLLYSFTRASIPLLLVEQDFNPELAFQARKDSRTKRETQVLYAGSHLGLMSYLFAK